MFTGLIQAVGKLHLRGNGFFVEGCSELAPLIIGDSVAVDGVCLTVAGFVSNGFIADVSEETISRCTLGKKAENGGYVNLEPALRLSDRLGGHLVSGHVDGLGEISGIEDLENSWKITVKWRDLEFGRYICEKASVALNGISLTVASFNAYSQTFSIAVIPHTWENTSLKYLNTGESVNLEADLMAKYAERLLEGKTKESTRRNQSPSSEISREWLKKQGW
tara:strand:- start:944 stop:1606 length:663 start_codon:yes stop_codon:yes gene_type:complete